MQIKSREINLGTHNYTGTAACGCVVAVVCDLPDDQKETARTVSDFIKSGLSVTRISHEEFRKGKFGHSEECKEKARAKTATAPGQVGLF